MQKLIYFFTFLSHHDEAQYGFSTLPSSSLPEQWRDQLCIRKSFREISVLKLGKSCTLISVYQKTNDGRSSVGTFLICERSARGSKVVLLLEIKGTERHLLKNGRHIVFRLILISRLLKLRFRLKIAIT